LESSEHPQSGGMAYLQKPFSPVKLLAKKGLIAKN
jgi:hypothetical protein